MNPESIERTQRFLFSSKEEMNEANLPKNAQVRLLRLRDIYLYWLRYPAKTDKAIAEEIRVRYNVNRTQSYDDVRILKICLGNIEQVTRQWCQYVFIQRCEEAFAMARAAGDANAFAKVLSSFGKFTRLDHDDLVGPDYSQIVPQQFELTSDPTEAGFARIPNVTDKITRLFQKYKGELDFAEYAEVFEPAEPLEAATEAADVTP